MQPIDESLLYSSSLKSFRDAVNMACMVSVTDSKGHIIYVNERFCISSKYQPHEVIGKKHNILLSRHHPSNFFQDMWDTISTGKRWRGEIKNRAKDGSYFWVDTVITPVYDDSDNIVQYMAVQNNITDQKEMENFRLSIFSALRVGIAVINRNGDVISTNKAWNNLVQQLSQEAFHAAAGENYIIKCMDAIEVGNFDAAKALAGINDVLLNNYNLFEMQFIDFSSGAVKYISMRVTPFLGGGAVLTYYDVTNEKKFQQEILEGKDKLHSLSAKVAKIGYWELEIATEKLHFTEELLHIFETDNIHTLTQYLSAIHPEDRDRIAVAIDAMTTGDDHAISYRIMTPGGQTKWLYTKPSGTAISNGRTMVCGTTQEISDIKNYEVGLELSLQELSDRYNDLMQFSYIVSHNLRGPIRNLVELTKMLKTVDLNDSDGKEVVSFIAEASQKLDTLTKDLTLVLATKSAAKRTELVDFQQLLALVISHLETEIASSETKLEVHIDPNVQRFYTVKAYMESIVYNLISNAIKYRSSERPLVVQISLKPLDDQLQLQISDNGIGINLNKHGSKIFNLYQRFNNQVEGKGMGLYMTKAQTESIGGKISVSSEPGEGTTFTVLFNNLNHETV